MLNCVARTIRNLVASVFLVAPLTSAALAAPGRLPMSAVPARYTININPNAAKLTFSGSEVIDIKVAKPTTTLTLNAVDINVTSATLDKTLPGTATYDAANQRITLTFSSAIAVGQHHLSLRYAGKIYQSASGLFALDYQGANGKERMLLTQFEAPDARRFAPMWDEPGIKAVFALSVHVPAGQSAFSNMPIATRHANSDGTQEVSFLPSPKMSSYLLFLGLGNIERHTVMSGKTEIGIITRKGVGHQGDYALASAKRILTSYNDYFGTPYPLPKLDMIAAPGTSQFFGAMENWGAILYFERTVLVDPQRSGESDKQNVFITVAHEMAHQWFGDLVTMKWWDDLWLNEGFASWMEDKVAAELNPAWLVDEQTTAGGRQRAFALDARSSTHPIIRPIETVDEIASAFDTITYQKGEQVIRLIEGAAGRDQFRAGIRAYMKANAYGNTTTDQLWDALEASSGKPIKEIAHSFTLQSGVPLLHVKSSTCIGGNQVLTVTQERFGYDAPSLAPREWRVPVIVRNAGGETARVVSGGAPQTITLAHCGDSYLNPGQMTYYRTLYDDGPNAAVVKQFPQFSLIDQIGALADAQALTSAGLQPATRYLDLVSSVPSSAHPMLWNTVARQLAGYDDLFGGAPVVPAYRAKALSMLRPVWTRVGLMPKVGEASSTSQLREELIRLMPQLGDAAITTDIRAAMKAGFDDATKLPAAIRHPVQFAYGYTNDAAGWEALRQRAKAEKDPQIKQDDYAALANVNDPVLAQKTLDLALTEELPVPVRPQLLNTVSGNFPEMAFDFAVAHADTINALLEESTRAGFIVGLANGSNDSALADRVKAYADRALAPQSRLAANTAIAGIRIRAKQRAELMPAFAAWVGSDAGTAKR